MDTSAAVEILLRDGARDLWSTNLQRERSRFLRKAAVFLKPDDRERLVKAIVAGPPRSMYRKDLLEEQFQRIAEREIWQNLAKLHESGAEISQVALNRFAELQKQHNWKLPEDHSDEFPIWIGDASEWADSSGVLLERLRHLTPEEAADLLASEKDRRIELLDDWRKLCEETPPTVAISIMKALFTKRIYDSEIWRMAFSVFWGRPEAKWQPEVWRPLVAFVLEFPDKLCGAINNTLSGWLSVLAKQLPNDEENEFWSVWDRLWSLSGESTIPGSSDGPVHAALNHPSGQLAEAVLTRLFKRKLSKDDGFPIEIRSRLDKIATVEGTSGVLGRVILASRLNNLFLLDRGWTSQHLLPKLDWSSSEAPALWHGYLWAPRCSPELLFAFKKSLLGAVARSKEFGERSTNLHRLFAAICIYDDSALTQQEMRRGVRALDADGLADVLSLLADTLRAAGEKAPTLWDERIGPWLKTNWPATTEKRNERTSMAAAQMAVSGGQAFPLIIGWSKDFLIPSGHVDQVIWRLKETDLPQLYPQATLVLLSKLAPENLQTWIRGELKEVLKRIASASPETAEEAPYKQLLTIAQKWT